MIVQHPLPRRTPASQASSSIAHEQHQSLLATIAAIFCEHHKFENCLAIPAVYQVPVSRLTLVNSLFITIY